MDEVTNMTVEVIDDLEEEMSLQYPERHKGEIKLSLNVSLKERERIERERETRGQSSQQEWFTVRSKRITGSKCGKILIQKRKSVSLLRQ